MQYGNTTQTCSKSTSEGVTYEICPYFSKKLQYFQLGILVITSRVHIVCVYFLDLSKSVTCIYIWVVTQKGTISWYEVILF